MISLNSVTLGYGREVVLRDVTLSVDRGEFVGIIGLSGAGKSTLLMSLIGNIQIFSGEYQAMGFDLTTIGKTEMRQLRSKIGFIFQGYNLVDRLSVFHNVMSGMLKDLPLSWTLLKVYQKKYAEKAYEYMKVVGIEHLALKRCDELSGGQRQRVAIARALAQEPRVILADEPVAALDPKSAQQVMDVLRKVNEKYQVTVITNLHHIDFAKNFCSRILGVACGEICFDGTVSELTGAALDKIYCCAAGTNDHAMIARQEKMLKKKPVQNADEHSRVVPAMFPDKMAA
jgi:phosphonate transport system ATP-binding protein